MMVDKLVFREIQTFKKLCFHIFTPLIIVGYFNNKLLYNYYGGY